MILQFPLKALLFRYCGNLFNTDGCVVSCVAHAPFPIISLPIGPASVAGAGSDD